MNTPTLTVVQLDQFPPLKTSWETLLANCPCNTIFLTWDWQDLWWRTIGEGELNLLTVQAGDEVVGIAPLVCQDGRWGFAGGVEVADFLDVIASPSHREGVARAVLEFFQRSGSPVELRNLRPASLGATLLQSAAPAFQLTPSLEPEDVSPRIELTGDWDSYLHTLSKKDRHELRRKTRRLVGAGEVRWFYVTDPATRDADVSDFLRLHRLSAESKAAFMTAEMEHFFRALVDEFVPRGLLRLYFLEVDGVRVASVILFDYEGEFLLYNSGYDPAYAHLSVGLLLKAFCIKDAIDEGRRVFDFLQGDESYKYDLGAVDVPILRLCLNPA
ncbi:MAG TPA: GNAT family N-acetyltransferase [Chloroflexota bacterium]|nr:GNAT family N-acetyltransferase [Chloroflexota bacterium]